jgi:exopolysaccharide production protein ExoQ
VTCVVLASEESGWARALAAGLATLCGILVLGSRSVGSLVVSFVSLSLGTLFLGFRASPRRGLAILAVFYVAATAVAAFVLFGVGLDGAIEALGRGPDLTGRMRLWPLVIYAIDDSPILGHGYAAFWSTHGGLADYIELSLGFRPFYAHNGFLDLALNTGLVGVLLFLVVMLTGLVRASFAAIRIQRAAAVWPLAIMVTFLAANVVESNIAQYNELNWVLFCIAFLYAAFLQRIEPSSRRAGRQSSQVSSLAGWRPTQGVRMDQRADASVRRQR